ncbi:MAG TPA: type IX secretion system membrane protein PorP/SprF, partial [Flavobacteriales bacterium]|nr:type IX secretion system membrane protein PorP/SprF [Flavobacteriales bacterium]
IPLDRRKNLHALVCFPISERFDLMPMFNHMGQATFRELDAGVNARYIILDRYGLRRALLFGPHVRARDAGYLFAGFQYDDWTFGASYDINTSDLVPASRNRGAIEFTLIRIWKKRPSVPVHFKACPSQI